MADTNEPRWKVDARKHELLLGRIGGVLVLVGMGGFASSFIPHYIDGRELIGGFAGIHRMTVRSHGEFLVTPDVGVVLVFLTWIKFACPVPGLFGMLLFMSVHGGNSRPATQAKEPFTPYTPYKALLVVIGIAMLAFFVGLRVYLELRLRAIGYVPWTS